MWNYGLAVTVFKVRRRSGGQPLVTMGSEDHMFLSSVDKLVSVNSSSELIILRNCGHVVNVEQPDQFNRQVIAYLKEFGN